jgi:hypothetical protein
MGWVGQYELLILNLVYLYVIQAWDMFGNVKCDAHQFECEK